jgi:putative transposase
MSTRRIGIGDWIDLDGEPHQIVALLGSNARLRSYSGAHQIALLAELLTHAQPAPAPAAGEQSDPSAQARLHLDRTALLDSLGEAGRARVLDLEGHLLELTTGYRSGTAERALPGEPRPDYTAEVPLMARVAAKAGELGISERWLRQLRDDWRERGLWALVDKRSTKPADPLAGIDPRLLPPR